jgi:hypothetical protein
MSNSSSSQPASINRVRHEIPLSIAQQQTIIDDLTETVDELNILHEPYSIVRKIGNIPLRLGDDSQLPSIYSNLHIEQAAFNTGSYKTRLTLPGYTMRLDGTRSNTSGLWRVSTGEHGKESASEHTDVIAYLRSVLPESTPLDQLADSASIDDKTINEHLWQLATLTDDWTEGRQYTASDYSIAVLDDKRIEPYFSEVGAMVGYTEGPDYRKYTSRIGTGRPIDFSWPKNTDSSSESTKAADDSKTSNGHTPKPKTEPVGVDEQYYFEVTYPNKLNDRRTALAHLAVESILVPEGRLRRLASDSVLFLDLDSPNSPYNRAISLIQQEYFR